MTKTKRAVITRIDPQKHSQLSELARRERRSLGGQVAKLIDDFLEAELTDGEREDLGVADEGR